MSSHPTSPKPKTLTGLHIRDLDEMVHAANMLMTLGARTVILKGGAIPGDCVYDVLVDAQGVEVYRNDRVSSRATHGAGTTLSAGLAIGLAQRLSGPGIFLPRPEIRQSRHR